MANPMPSTSSDANLAELMAITSPLLFTKAPPLFPGLIAASVWISFTDGLSSPLISRSFALTYPTVTLVPYPRAFPIAMARSPTFVAALSPIVAILIFFFVAAESLFISTSTTARSLEESVPFTVASAVDLSLN